MKRFNSSLIGIFVIGAIILAVVGIISFGGQAWWRDRETVVIYFDDSVHGLERGSAVRLMGVRVGRVSSINVSYLDDRGAMVQVVCEIDRSPVGMKKEERDFDIRKREALEEMVDEGLQARLDLIGITGMLYVEMDFFGRPPDRSLALEHPDYVVVPSISSSLTGITDNLADISRELGSIDFAGLGDSAQRLLDTANAALDEARLEELFARLHQAVGGVNALLESEELKNTLVSAGQSFDDLSRLATRLEGQVDPLADSVTATSEEMQRTLEEVAQTFHALQDMIGPRMGLGIQLGDTLSTIDEAARSVERLANFLERNPQALMRGRLDER